MKRIILLTCLFTLLIGCSTQDDELDPYADELGVSENNDVTTDGYFGVDGVLIWNKETELTFTDYYSQIDTIITDRTIQRNVKYYRSENETVSVQWRVNGILQSDVKETKIWKGEIQKWLVESIVNADINGINKDLQIEAIVQYPDRKVRRFKTIQNIITIKDVSDILRCTFGTPRTEMSHLIGRDISPQISLCDYDEKPPHVFEFSNGKLIRLYVLYSTKISYKGFLDIIDKCHVPIELEYDDNGLVLNPQEWNFGNLNFSVYSSTLSSILKMEGQVTYDYDISCLVIEKR